MLRRATANDASVSYIHAQMFGDGEDVLVAAPTQVHEDDLILAHGRRELSHLGEGVCRLERRDDALDARAHLKGVERLLVRCRHVAHPAGVAEPRMLGADAGIIEPSGDGVPLQDLAVTVLEQVGAVAVEDARAAAIHRCSMTVLDVESVATGLDAVDRDFLVVEEWMEQPDGVRASADTRNDR